MITVNNLSFAYRKNKKLFNNLSIQYNTGNIYGLLGRNGAGKTTLLRLITGLLYPTEGECIMKGENVNDRLPEILEDICFLPEEYNLPSISLEKYTKVNSVFYNKFSDEDLKKYIQEFELDKTQKLSTMSYGQKKKYLIAFGLATNAGLLVLDEPTNGLDIPSKSQFRKLMASSINDDRCFIISTHQVRDLENLIDPIVIIENGTIIFNETIENITSKLVFGNIENYEEPDVLYSEGIEGKKKGVMVNKNGISTSIDQELLFNTIMQQYSKIKEIFKL